MQIVEYLSSYGFAIYFLLSLVAFGKWFQFVKAKKLIDLVAWSITGDHSPAMHQYSFTRELLDQLFTSQHRLNIPQQYRLTRDTDKEAVLRIIEQYQIDTARSFFLGHLNLIKSKYAIDPQVFFMILLHDYLMECENKQNFFDSPAVFYKMFYLTHVFCKDSLITNPNGHPNWGNWIENHLVEQLEQITGGK